MQKALVERLKACPLAAGLGRDEVKILADTISDAMRRRGHLQAQIDEITAANRPNQVEEFKRAAYRAELGEVTEQLAHWEGECGVRF